MKKMILLSFLVLFIPVIGFAQDKIEAPIWNIGDKWVLGESVTIVVVNADENSYAVKYLTSGGESILVYEKSSLNRLYSMEKDRRIPYEGRNKRLFNFPLEVGKSWRDKYTIGGTTASREYTDTFTALGWEEIKVQAGKFRAVRLEYKQEMSGQIKGQPKEGKIWYWYSPDVKYMVKCQYEKSDYWDASYDWELISFELKK